MLLVRGALGVHAVVEARAVLESVGPGLLAAHEVNAGVVKLGLEEELLSQGLRGPL